MKTFSNRELAKIFAFSLHAVRRWGCDLFGVDPKAGRSSGQERRYTQDEAFLVALLGYLITRCGLTTEKAKRHVLNFGHQLMLADIWPDMPSLPEVWLLIFNNRYALKIVERRDQVGDTIWGENNEPTLELFVERFRWISFPQPVEVGEAPLYAVPITQLINNILLRDN